MHHPLGNADISAAGAVLAAAELTGVLNTAQSAKTPAHDDTDLQKQAYREFPPLKGGPKDSASDGNLAFLRKSYSRLACSEKQWLWECSLRRSLKDLFDDHDELDTPTEDLARMNDILEGARQQQAHKQIQAEVAQRVSMPVHEPLSRPPLDRKLLSVVLVRCIRGTAPSSLVRPKKVRMQISKFAKEAKIWKTEPRRRCFGQVQKDPLPLGLPMCLCPEFHQQIQSTVRSFLAGFFGRTAESGLRVPRRKGTISRRKKKKKLSYFAEVLQREKQQAECSGTKLERKSRKRSYSQIE